MLLVAHRAFRQPGQENRKIDFQNSLKVTKASEFDIRLTKDKQIVIFHDHNFKRIAGHKENVFDLTYSEIEELEFFKHNPEWLPYKFDEFLANEGAEHTFMNIEIKGNEMDQNDLDIVISRIKQIDLPNCEIVVSSFEQHVKEELVKHKDDLKIGFLVHTKKEWDKDLASQFDFIHPDFKFALKNAEMFKELNIPLNPWTFTEDKQARKINDEFGSLAYGYISDKDDLTYE